MDKTFQQILEYGKHLEKQQLTYQSRGSKNPKWFRGNEEWVGMEGGTSGERSYFTGQNCRKAEA